MAIIDNSSETLRAVSAHMDRERSAQREAVRSALRYSSVPLPEQVVDDLANLNPADAHDVLREHPGHTAYQARESHRMCLRLFDQALHDLFEVFRAFDETAQDTDLFFPTRKHKVATARTRVKKEVYAVASAAHSLVDHSRSLKAKIPVPGYDARRAAVFRTDGLHEFVIELRNIQHHIRMFEVGVRIQRSFEGDEPRAVTGFEFERDTLLQIEEWNEAAEAYLRNAGDRIDLSHVFRDYGNRVGEFHTWFAEQLQAIAPAAVVDYERCLKRMRIVTSRISWRMILTTLLSREDPIDPYEYLYRYLTAAQLSEVSRLPHHSQTQVDRIIECVDIDGACDDEIRGFAYELFRVG